MQLNKMQYMYVNSNLFGLVAVVRHTTDKPPAIMFRKAPNIRPNMVDNVVN
jgi:hypothetical protein